MYGHMNVKSEYILLLIIHNSSKRSLTDRNTPKLNARDCHVLYGEILLDLQSGQQVKVCWTRGLSVLAADHHADSSVNIGTPRPSNPHLFVPSCPV